MAIDGFDGHNYVVAESGPSGILTPKFFRGAVHHQERSHGRLCTLRSRAIDPSSQRKDRPHTAKT